MEGKRQRRSKQEDELETNEDENFSEEAVEKELSASEELKLYSKKHKHIIIKAGVDVSFDQIIGRFQRIEKLGRY